MELWVFVLISADVSNIIRNDLGYVVKLCNKEADQVYDEYSHYSQVGMYRIRFHKVPALQA